MKQTIIETTGPKLFEVCGMKIETVSRTQLIAEGEEILSEIPVAIICGAEIKIAMTDQPLVVSQETMTESIGGKENITHTTRRKGLHWLTTVTGERVLVDESATMDSGKLGTSLCFTAHSDEVIPEEVRARNRANIQHVTAKAMVDMGIW